MTDKPLTTRQSFPTSDCRPWRSVISDAARKGVEASIALDNDPTVILHSFSEADAHDKVDWQKPGDGTRQRFWRL
ncbi:hypothetical protein HB777_12160 [Mesorhizobium loti]|nr:hypothetical protein HB777_12160 [Mesorhizobium loti]